MKLKFINYFMNIAEETSKLSSAIKLKVGCIAVNNDRILTALEYSGKWDLSISLDIFAKDSYKIEEIITLIP